MAFQVQGNSGIIAEVDGTTFRALRVTARPIEYGALGFYRVAAQSGTIAVSQAAGAENFQFRWPDATRFNIVYRCFMSAGGPIAAATAVAYAAMKMTIARAWTAAGSAGTRLTLTGNNQKLRTSMGSSLVNDIGINTTLAAGLTAGTKTLDAQDIGAVATGITLAAATVQMFADLYPHTEFLDVNSPSDHPIVLAQNEGFVIRNGTNAMPAGMTWHFVAGCSWAEVVAY